MLDPLGDGDVVFVDASEDLEGIGKSVELKGMRDRHLVAGLHTIAVRFSKLVLANGFKAYLQFHPTFLRHLRRLAAGTKVYATNRADIASARLSLPPLPEQRAMATVLSDMDAEIAALQRRLDKTLAIKQGMVQQLLAGSIRLPIPATSVDGEPDP
jgi:type I restriction enzyme S subunit